MKTCIIPSRLDNRRMNIADQHKKAAEFIERWQGRGDEKQETQKFWLDLMQNVLDVPDAINNTEFEYRTANRGYIDMLCPDSSFLVEQKSKNVDLDKPEERHSLALLTVRIVFCLYD